MSNSEVRRYNNYIDGLMNWHLYNFHDKKRNVKHHVTYMLDRTQSLFRWEGLPDSIPQRILEFFLQTNGNICFYEHEGELYVFTGGLGGEPDVYYRPTIYTIANPGLKLSKSLKIGKECVVMPNDSMYRGLLPMFYRYATMMAETELSLDIANINSRILSLISAPDDRTKESALKYLSDVREGKLGVIAENAFLDGIKATPYSTSSRTSALTDLIELMQYTKASWFNEMGLNANYNMKRESLNSAESQLNNDALLPLIDDMLRQRELGAEEVNKMFGTNISVSFNSAWEDNVEEIELEHEKLESEVKAVSNQSENPQESEDPEEPETEEETEDDTKGGDNDERDEKA